MMKFAFTGWNWVEAFDSISKVFDIVNCSAVTGLVNIGTRQQDGSYTGALGMILRKVSNDMIIGLIR